MWDERYGREDYHFGTEPNAFLRAQAHRLSPGTAALAVADGEGRNGVWLAGQGLKVTAVDSSPVGLAKAKRLAEERGVSMECIEADLADWTWPSEAFDVVVAIFIQFADPTLRKTIFDGMKQALKPGGLVLMEGYRPEQLAYGTGGPKVLDQLYTRELLEEHFGGFEIVELREHDSEIHEGKGHQGMSALIDLVARKPG